jgi:ABC-type glycerol-3-phosphate transport system substrate-binding protein
MKKLLVIACMVVLIFGSTSLVFAKGDQEETPTTMEGPVEVTITFWDWQVYPTYQEYSDKMVEAYNASQDKVKLTVEREAIGFLDYKPKFQAAASAGELPDMYQVWLGVDIYEFTDAGLLYDFTEDIKNDPEWNDWYSDLWDNGENQDAKGRVRGIPADQFVLGVAYFNDMLEAINGGVRPETVDEAIALIPAVEKEGKFLYATGFLSTWTLYYAWVTQIKAYDIPGEKSLLKRVEAGEVSWNNEVFLKCLTSLKKLYDAGSFRRDVLALDFAVEGYDDFHNQKSLMEWSNGSWRISGLREVFGDTSNIGLMPYPLPDTNGSPRYCNSVGLIIGTHPDNPKLEYVKDYLKFYMSPQGVEVALSIGVMPASKVPKSLSIDDPMMKVSLEELSKYGGVNANIYNIDVANAIGDAFVSVLNDEITPEEALESFDQYTMK